jgi:two-component system response regulator QseB
MRALLIEDDEDLGEIIRTALAREGNTVDWVKDGQAAISALSTENFDIAI